MEKNRHTRKRTQKRHRHRRRTMKGGSFIQEELQQLENIGFSQYQIESLTDLGVSFNDVMQTVNTIMNRGDNGFNGNSDDMTEKVMIELLNENIFDNQPAEHLEGIPHADDDEHNLDVSMDNSFESQDSLHLSDLNTSNMSGYTTSPDESFNEFGGRRRRKKSKKRLNKKGKKTRRRKQRGGMCFGNGVGANTNDPNYSIYNTNMLKIFPYKPN